MHRMPEVGGVSDGADGTLKHRSGRRPLAGVCGEPVQFAGEVVCPRHRLPSLSARPGLQELRPAITVEMPSTAPIWRKQLLIAPPVAKRLRGNSATAALPREAKLAGRKPVA